MEKATAVYNKLKLQFIGKIETSKPKPDEKNQETNEQDTGKLSNNKFSQAVIKWVLKHACPLCLLSRRLQTSERRIRKWEKRRFWIRKQPQTHRPRETVWEPIPKRHQVKSVLLSFSWSLSKIITQLADLFCICLSGPIQKSQQRRKHSQLSPQRPSRLQTQTEKRTAERRTSRCLLRAEPFTNTLWLPSFICVTFCLPTFVTYMSFSCCT